MRILGIDPGSAAIGYALIDYEHPRVSLSQAHWINLTHIPRETRILTLHQELQKIIHDQNPNVVAIEQLFFAKNTKTAFAVSESRGAIVLTSLLAGLKVFEYTPLEVKQAVTGYGKADKTQVKKMIQLCVEETKKISARDDVFDAIAIALTCAWREKHY